MRSTRVYPPGRSAYLSRSSLNTLGTQIVGFCALLLVNRCAQKLQLEQTHIEYSFCLPPGVVCVPLAQCDDLLS